MITNHNKLSPYTSGNPRRRSNGHTCGHDGCTFDATGRSKYCTYHRDVHYGQWRDKVKASSKVKAERIALFERVWDEAVEAGMVAGEECVPRPMVIQGYAPITEGMCGFAQVRVKPGNSAFANWLKKQGHMSPDSYTGGVYHYVGLYGQSWERKRAFARAMSSVLAEAFPKLNIYATDRLD